MRNYNGKYKVKAIKTDLGTFRYNQANLALFRHIQNPVNHGIPRTWHIQNQKHIPDPDVHNRFIFKTPVFSERLYIQNLGHIQNPLNYLR